MGCTCRVAPLRFFVQGLSQVHRLEVSSFPRFHAPPTSSLAYNSQLLVARQSRLLHVSRRFNHDATVGEASSPEALVESNSTPPSTSETALVNNNHEEAMEVSAITKTAEPTERIGGTDSELPTTSEQNQKYNENSKPSGSVKNLDHRGKKPKWTAAEKAQRSRMRKPHENLDHRGKKPRWTDSEKAEGGRTRKPHGTLDHHGKKPRSMDSEKAGEARPWKSYDSNSPKPTRDTETSPTPSSDPLIEEPTNDKPLWRIQKEALKEKFPDGWKPRKRLSPDALAGIRALNAQFPDVYTTSTLASRFEVSPENIRRILKSKWQPNADEEKGRQERWFKRGMQVWDHQAALGMKPPRKWRLEGVTRDPEYHVRRQVAIKRNRELEEQDDREIRANMGKYTPGRSYSAKPSSGRPYLGKPSSDKQYSRGPSSRRPSSDRPSSSRPPWENSSRDRPFPDDPFSDKPAQS
ncbi:hypothetical protein B0T10DRAFT_491850 [Thelonectria olida]|uniref:Required for respiratory growth protein 9, mitochondrial n=1 Tax=Thelonectria olida TaxID=1576542 RepID=A0A9P8W0R7_9HYPO|nr:hypothetical protein B0T10DRAFT_491850 [Thelonectria olida]